MKWHVVLGDIHGRHLNGTYHLNCYGLFNPHFIVPSNKILFTMKHSVSALAVIHYQEKVVECDFTTKYISTIFYTLAGIKMPISTYMNAMGIFLQDGLAYYYKETSEFCSYM